MDYERSREIARRKLPKMLFEYIDGGSYSEVTLGRNLSDFQDISLRQRVLVDGSKLNQSIQILGDNLSMPIILGPVGFAGMFAKRGEVQAAISAEKNGLQTCLSSLSICSIDEVCSATNQPPWFQLYMIKDRSYIIDLLSRVWSAGVRILVITVDLPLPGTRYRDARSGFQDTGISGLLRKATQAFLRPSWLWSVQVCGRPHCFGNFNAAADTGASFGDQWEWVKQNFDASVAWEDISWVRANWRGSIVVKGILDPEDAELALAHGVDGIIISNHGGRQLDSVRSSISAVESIVDRIGGEVTVMVDGGIRNGLDVLKALSLGVQGVLLGRSWAFALAAAGSAGVDSLIDRFRQELSIAMILTGCSDIRNADRRILDQWRPWHTQRDR